MREKKRRATAAETAPRSRVVAAARRHFLAHGFRGVTMNDLAEELGMSKKTLYAHFTSKTALLEAVLSAQLPEVASAVATIATEWAAAFPTRPHRSLGAPPPPTGQ